MAWLKRYGLGLAVLGLFLLAAWMIYQKLHPKTLPANLVMGVGRIDGDLLNLNAKYPGRVTLQNARDGMLVKRGELLTRLSSPEQEAKLAQLRAETEARRKTLAAKETELSIARETIPLALKSAEAQLKAAVAAREGVRKEIAAQQEVLLQDARDYNRTQNLYARHLVQKELLEKARLKYRVDREKLEGLRAREREAATAIDAARVGLEKAQAEQRRIDALAQDIAALRKGIAAMEAAQREVEAVLAEMRLRSPITGYVIEKIAEVGEVVGAGMPVATLIDPRTLYLKIFVDTLENGKIKLGDKGVIFLDAWPDRPIPAQVVRIAQKAEFTPKEVSVRSDRIQRVYAVHLKPLRPDPLLKLGLPATGVITLDGRGLPRSLEELPPL